MKKLMCVLLAMLLSVGTLALTACGKDKGGNQEINVNLPTDYKASISIGVMDDTREEEVAANYIKGFNKIYPNITVKVERMTTGIAQLATTGTLQDVVHTGSIASLAKRNVFQSLTPYMEASGFDTSLYYDSMIKIGQYKNQQYMLPRDYNKITLVYNKNLFDLAGVAYPEDDWTWDEFVETCDAIKKGLAKKGKTDVYAIDAMMVWDVIYYTMGVGYGGTWFDTDGTAKFEGLEEGLTKLQDLYIKGYAVDPTNKTQNIFLNEKAAMWFLSRPAVFNCAESLTGFDFAPFPALPTPKTGAGCTGYSINNRSKDKNAAWALINYIMSEDGMEMFSETGAAVPSMKKLAEDEEGTWTEYPSPFMNHQAFVMYPERDFIPPYADYYDELFSTDINNTVLNLLDVVIHKKYGEGQEYTTLEALVAAKAAEINNIQKG